MNRTSVSVVVPAYNAARTIGRAIDSLLAQTSLPDEILVVDDGSSDHLESALEPYRGMVTLVRKPNGGPASARNLGIDRSRGEFVAFLDADDCWEPCKLQRQLELLNRYPKIALISSLFYNEEPGGCRYGPSTGPACLLDRVVMASGFDLFEMAVLVLTSTVIVRRTALGDLRFESGLEPAEDRDLWIRLLRSHSAYIIAEPLATIVLEPGSLSRSDPDKSYAPMIRVLHRYANLLDRAALAKLEARVFRGWAGTHLAEGRPKSALRPAIQRLAREPRSLEGWWVLLKCAWLASVRRGTRKTRPVLTWKAPCEPVSTSENLSGVSGGR
jgi:glycosyltransferase involved in cell wall biosynthesis